MCPSRPWRRRCRNDDRPTKDAPVAAPDELIVRRVHLFEFEDCAWFPAGIRNLMTDFLRDIVVFQRLHRPIVAKLRDALERTGGRRIVDLCSGGGGLLPAIHAELTQSWQPVSVVFTDKFPSVESLRRVCRRDPQHLDVAPFSVDCTNVPGELAGFRSMFSAFHHFDPPTARHILEDAYRKRMGIGIFEVSERAAWSLLRISLVPIGVWLYTPLMSPLTWRRLLWTYVVPIVPLALLWDGIVSALRTYTTSELYDLTQDMGGGDYGWDIGQLRAPFGYKVTYLIGVPTTSPSVQ
jgi:hypothetical protein